MQVTRGAFLKGCAAAFVAPPLDGLHVVEAVAGPWVAPVSTPASAPVPTPCHGADVFRHHLHTTFTAGREGEPGSPIVLVRVTDGPVNPRVEQFSLVFRAGGAGVLTQGIHHLRHADLGAIDLFIAPVGSGRNDGATYEACFSRLVDAE